MGKVFNVLVDLFTIGFLIYFIRYSWDLFIKWFSSVDYWWDGIIITIHGIVSFGMFLLFLFDMFIELYDDIRELGGDR